MASKKTPKPRAKKVANNGPQKLSVYQGIDSDAVAQVEQQAADGSATSSQAPTDSSSQQAGSTAFPTEATKEGKRETDSLDAEDRSTAATTKLMPSAGNTETGDVASLSAVAESRSVYGPLAHEETRAQASNRWILEGRRWETDNYRKDIIRQCRSEGMTKEAASEHAWKACLARFPPPGNEVSVIAPPEAVAAEPEPVEADEPPPAPIPSDQGVPGLGTIPTDWPKLSANASLQAEIAWVSANRLLVRDGSGVDLSKALSPAPSYSALSWLETSILFPSKFADISVKATQNQEDEAQHVRREKLAIEEIRSLLAEMMEDD